MKAVRQLDGVGERLGKVRQAVGIAWATRRARAAWGIAAVATLGILVQPACRVADSYLTRPQAALSVVPVAEAAAALLDAQSLPVSSDFLAEAAAAESAVIAAEAALAAPDQSAAPEPAAAAAAPEADTSDTAATVSSAAPGWHSAEVSRIPFDPDIERWRPLVREELAQAYAEGRLTGGAARLDDDVVLALIEQESGGDDQAYSWAGAIGLAQVMPFTYAFMLYGDESLADSIGEDAMFDPRTNLRAGIRYLALAMQDFGGSLYWSLSSYNAGIGAVEEWRSVGLASVPPIGGYVETAGYAPAILSNLMGHRPGLAVAIPAPMTDEQVDDAVARLEAAGLW